jgi:hypothetical protein
MNSASRILSIVEYFGSQPSAPMSHRWCSLFGIDINKNRNQLFPAVLAFHAELDAVETKMLELSGSSELFGPTAQRLRSSFNPSSVEQPWDSHAPHVMSAENLNALKWAKWALQKFDDPEPEQGVMEALLERIEEQEEHLRSTALPAGIRLLMISHIAQMRVALAMYKIQGVTAISDVVQKAMGEMGTAPEHLKDEVAAASPEAKGVIVNFMKFIGQTAKFADDLSKVKKFGEAVYTFGTQHGHTAITWVSDLVRSIPQLAAPT